MWSTTIRYVFPNVSDIPHEFNKTYVSPRLYRATPTTGGRGHPSTSPFMLVKFDFSKDSYSIWLDGL